MTLLPGTTRLLNPATSYIVTAGGQAASCTHRESSVIGIPAATAAGSSAVVLASWDGTPHSPYPSSGRLTTGVPSAQGLPLTVLSADCWHSMPQSRPGARGQDVARQPTASLHSTSRPTATPLTAAIDSARSHPTPSTSHRRAALQLFTRRHIARAT